LTSLYVLCRERDPSTQGAIMLTNIDIDDTLMSEAIRATGAPTRKAVVEEGLRLLVRLAAQKRAVEDMMGLGWEGDLDASREGRAL
jgi:Arc/MetJ family transcription regulator